MKRKIVCLWLVLALAVGLAWYNHQYHCYGYPFVTTPSGLSYKAIGRKGNGKKVQDGEWVELSLVMKAIPKKRDKDRRSNPTEVDKDKKSSATERILINKTKPFLLRFDQSFQSENKQIAEMIGMMQEKQQMIFKSAPEYYLEEANPERLEQLLKALHLNKEDELVVNIKLDKIMTDEAYKQMLDERRQMLDERRATQLAKDKQLITDYLAAHHIEASSTDSGLFYIIDQPSQSTAVVKDKTIKVHYTGRLLDGTVFDTSLEEVAKANKLYDPQKPYKPLKFQVGTGYVIQGWDEGLLLLKKDEKARFFIPSALAYGPKAMGSIPANAILLFEVEVVDVF